MDKGAEIKSGRWKAELVEFFEESVFSIPSTPLLFNPWRDADRRYSVPDAAEIRRKNLGNFVSTFEEKPRVLIFGEALGPRGGRFSGIPFTSESQILAGTAGFFGQKTSLRDSPYREASATLFWKNLGIFRGQFLQWNCIPFYPCPAGERMGVRTPTTEEVKIYQEHVETVVTIVDPSVILGVGRKASQSLLLLGLPHTYIRHPSHGGAKAFAIGVKKVFSGWH